MSKTLIKAMLSSPFKAEVAKVSRQVHLDEKGLIHASGECSGIPSVKLQFEAVPNSFRYRRPEIKAEPLNHSLTLPEFLKANVCSQCEYSFMSRYGRGWYSDPVFAQVAFHTETLQRLVKMRKVTKSTTASAVQKRLGDLKMIEYHLAKPGVSLTIPNMREAYDALADEVEATRKALRAVAFSDESRLKVEAKVRELMVPKRFAGQDIRLDRTPCLIGISPTPVYRGNQVGAVVDAYAIRNDTATVLVAPAYIYSFLLQQLFPKSSSNTLIVSAPLPESPEVQETAAKIWDPEGASSLACMQASVETAMAILGVEAPAGE